MKTVDPRPGERLRQIREHRELSQGQIARALRVTIGAIQHYEQGRTRITTQRLDELARALQCEAADLLMPPDSPPPRYRRPRYRPFQEWSPSRGRALNHNWEQWVSFGDD